MLCFSKISKFQIFYSSKLLLDRSKLWLKFWFESAWLDRCSIDARSIKSIFWSIKAQFRPIEIRKLSVLKNSLNDFRLIENYIRSIQHQLSIDRTRHIQTKILITISISREIGSIDRKSRKKKFWKTKQFYAETPQSTIFYE